MGTAPAPIRVLVVDDSASVRRALTGLLQRDPGVTVVDTAADGLDALAKIRAARPDVVTLDVMMPRLDGLKVLAAVMRETPARVVMLSSLTQEGAEVTLQALELGAVDFIDKTGLGSPEEGERVGRELLAKVHAAASVDRARLGPRPVAVRRVPTALAGRGSGRAAVIVIGASTGGPAALQRLIPALPGDLPAAVVVVQHIPAAFTRPLAARLDGASALSVREAAAGETLRPGTVLITPGGLNLSFSREAERVRVVLGTEQAGAALRPSVDVTMRSAAAAWGRHAAGVLLTGMGVDGAAGMFEIHRSGGHTIAESEETCVVYGMPRAAVELGAAEEVVPLDRIAERIAAIVTD